MHAFLVMGFPGLKRESLPRFFTGLVERFLQGAYPGLVFVPIYNILLKGRGAGNRKT